MISPLAGVVRARFVAEEGSSIVPFGLPLAPKDAPLGAETLRLVHASHDESESARDLVRAVPSALDLPPGTVVAILELSREREGLFTRFLPRRRVAPEIACAALLARGYRAITRVPCPHGAGTIALGTASPAGAPPTSQP